MHINLYIQFYFTVRVSLHSVVTELFMLKTVYREGKSYARNIKKYSIKKLKNVNALENVEEA